MATVPTIVLTVQEDHIEVAVTSNVADSHVEVERQFAGGAWVLLSDSLPVGTSQDYLDYHVADGVTAFYRATAVDGSAGRATSLTSSAVQSLSGVVAHVVTRGSQTNKSGSLLSLSAEEGMVRESSRAETIQQLPSLTKPVVDVGTLVSRKWEMPLLVTDTDDLATIKSWRDSRSVICIRNGTAGDIIFGVIPDDGYTEDLNATGSLVIHQVDYRESASPSSALAAPDGVVDYRLRFVLFDKERNEIGETDSIIGGFVRKTRKARIRSGAQFVVRRRDRDLDTYATLVLASSPLFHWRLGDTSGTTATDASGNGRNGTYNGSPTLNQPSLLPGDLTNGSVLFDGTNDYVSIADAAWMDTTFVTHLAWIKTSYVGANQFITSRDNFTSDRQYALYVAATTGYLSAVLNPGGVATAYNSSARVADGRYHLVAITYDGSYVRLYVDGRIVLKTAASGAMGASALALRVGAATTGGGEFNGYIDEVAMFGAALPASEIRALYQQGSNRLFEIDYLTDRIIPYVQQRQTDGSYSEWPIGEFIIPAPTRADDETTSRHTVQAYDKLKLFDDYKVSTRYAIASGVAYTTAIATALNLLLQTSEYTITPSALTLFATRSWEIGTSLLDIVNDLLKGLNYTPLRFNGSGVAVLEPYVEPASRTPDATWNVDEDSYVGFDMELTTTVNETYNQVIAKRTTPKGALLTATASNNEASHPTSIPNLGYPKAIQVENSDAANQTALSAFARAELIKYMAFSENQKRQALLQPWLDEESIIEINDTETELSGTFLVNEVNISLDGRPPFWQDFLLERVPELS
jgi:hypothetical protein